jgi:glucosamine 6-phosphate synthetase-like amidotransferase/phosphosugar isomerase protein
MCRIIGYIGSKPVVPVLIDGLRRMEYRGYDSAGVAVVGPEGIELRRSAGKLANLELTIQADPVDGLYGVGHTRWATHGRPTEENAHPHRDCTGRIVVVHNGITENYLELTAELQELGHTFRTHCDTEVIVHAWEQWGEACVARLRGMFAFTIWDRNQQTLFMARDRLGIKPMHYAFLPDGMLAFGSELKTLLCFPNLSREIDPRAAEPVDPARDLEASGAGTAARPAGDRRDGEHRAPGAARREGPPDASRGPPGPVQVRPCQGEE